MLTSLKTSPKLFPSNFARITDYSGDCFRARSAYGFTLCWQVLQRTGLCNQMQRPRRRGRRPRQGRGNLSGDALLDNIVQKSTVIVSKKCTTTMQRSLWNAVACKDLCGGNCQLLYEEVLGVPAGTWEHSLPWEPTSTTENHFAIVVVETSGNLHSANKCTSKVGLYYSFVFLRLSRSPGCQGQHKRKSMLGDLTTNCLWTLRFATWISRCMFLGKVGCTTFGFGGGGLFPVFSQEGCQKR